MHKLNTTKKQTTQIQQKKTTLVQFQSPLRPTTLDQKTTWAYSTTLPSPHARGSKSIQNF